MRTAAILPVKRFARAKQRLGASVADQLRLQLASAMVASRSRRPRQSSARSS
jgi:2-phospho-L-lactate guanylyltransferase (CobY/MobA/RfbA family)